jgi:trehalase-like protein
MSLPIEDYALIGDCHTAALVGRDGSIDWLCLPRFDSGACFAALLGGPGHGRWLIAPAAEVHGVRRRYRDGTLILETEFETNEGAVRIIDCMPLSNERWDVLRIVEGLRGRVAMRMELIIRFDYGSIVPWVQRSGDTLLATAGPDTLELHTEVAVHGENMKTVAEFHVSKGQQTPFALNYRPSHEATQQAIDPEQRSGLWQAVQGRVLIYIHKERMLEDVEQRYPARHYVIVDDKLRILAAMKKIWRDRLTTVFPRQGHYALDPNNLAAYPPADITVERIGDLVNYDLSALLGAAKAGCAESEEL